MNLNELDNPAWKALSFDERTWLLESYYAGNVEKDEVQHYVDLILSQQQTIDKIEGYIQHYLQPTIPDKDKMKPVDRATWDFVEKFVKTNQEILETQGNAVYVQGNYTSDAPYGFTLNLFLIGDEENELKYEQELGWQSILDRNLDDIDSIIGTQYWKTIYEYRDKLNGKVPFDMHEEFEQVEFEFTMLHPVLIGTPLYTPGGKFGEPDQVVLKENRDKVLDLCRENRFIAAMVCFGIEQAVSGE